MKKTPIEKIPEAYSAIADHRVSMCADSAVVRSSDGKKEYKVRWNKNGEYSSDDSATFWQGYAGYPIIAVLMLQHKLPLDYDVASNFKGINWNELNKKYKNNYARALDEVLQQIEASGSESEKIYSEIQRAYDALENLSIKIKRKI